MTFPAQDTLDVAIAGLKADALAGFAALPLRGRNVGILCADLLRPEVFLLQRGLQALGARVALIRSNPGDADDATALADTARMLGRLYDTVLCVDLALDTVRPLRDAACVPVVANVVDEWLALLAHRPDAQDDVRYLLQALLIDLCA